MIDRAGRLRFVDSPGATRELAALEAIRGLGAVSAGRFSRVEMGEDGGWWVEILAGGVPGGGRKYGPFWPRSRALEFEHGLAESWLTGEVRG